MLLFAGSIAILIFVAVYWFVDGDVERKAGIYRLPGKYYWLKRLVFYILYHVRSLSKKDRRQNGLKVADCKSSHQGLGMKGIGKKQTEVYEALEKPQQLPDDPFAIDTCYFGGTDKDGGSIVCRLARRNNRYAEVWLFLEVPGIGCLQHTNHPDTHVYYTDESTSAFKAGGLTLEVLEPMRRWRISFSGMMRKGLCNDIENKTQDFVEVSFHFIWSAFSQPFNFDTDLACNLLGDNIARERWSRAFFSRLKRLHQTHYEQWGELRGQLCVEGHDARTMIFQCVRDHSVGRRDWREFHRYIIHFIYLETGMSIQVGMVSQPNLMSHVKCGYLSYANGDIVSLSDVDLKLWEVGETSNTPPKSYTFSFMADGVRYTVEVEGGTTPIWYHHEDRGGKVMEIFSKFKVNSKPGRGITEFFYRNKEGPTFTPPQDIPMLTQPLTEVMESNRDKFTLRFSDLACQSPLLVGGKGAQLAQLTSVQKEVKAAVPSGFCLTLYSFQLQLKSNPSIEQAILEVKDSCIYNLENLVPACNACVNLIISTDICPKVKEAVLKSLEQLKEQRTSRYCFAVRSSAAGEDGEDASSAGQLKTILGLKEVDKIMEAIKECWSSAYTHQAVEYRRQHGQPIQSSVGVVVQEMVPAEAAGVMFTADPVTGSSSYIVINSNFGLGESVVSGESNPDNITVQRDPDSIGRGGTDGLMIKEIIVGKKGKQIVEDVEGGTKGESVPHKSSLLSISEKVILKLAQLGIELEKRFGCPRDVEWAVVKENIYLLQCRPITVASTESEDDFVNEFNSPMTCDFLWNTTANISEMMPGAVTPLTMSTFVRVIDYSLQVLNHHAGGRRTPTNLSKGLAAVANHIFISLIDISTMFVTTLLVRKDIMEISLVGNLLPELQVAEAEDYYGRKEGVFRKLLNFIRLLRLGSRAALETSKWERKIPSYSIGGNAKTAEDLYNCIHSSLCDYEGAWGWPLINSSRSGNWASIIMSILNGNTSDWTSSHYGDMALLLSKCQNVYSAEIPQTLKAIAKEISSIKPSIVTQFLETSDKNYMDIIYENPSVHRLVNSFLQRHGHRCLRESELREESWKTAPEKLMPVLKVMVKTKSFEKDSKEGLSIPQLLDQLKSKPKGLKRFMLKLLLPKAWEAVGAREWGKSVSVQMSDIFKTAYSRLSHLMQQEGRIPDSDLIYFLTHEEIGTFLRTTSSKFITRAQKRRRALVRQQQLEFNKLTRGRPVPSQITSSIRRETSVTSHGECLKGMPVSQGCVQGPARVIHSLDLASAIQAGDILVVKSTDVGWSPYFPLIGGLITELGGLISHGAVVAREYGIPCVVNVANAMSLLTSGDMLEIDGRQGIIRWVDKDTN